MIAIDTSAFQRFVGGFEDDSALAVQLALREKIAYLPPIVLSEVLSHPGLLSVVADSVRTMDLLPIRDGMWERAGLMRADLIRRGLKGPPGRLSHRPNLHRQRRPSHHI